MLRVSVKVKYVRLLMTKEKFKTLYTCTYMNLKTALAKWIANSQIHFQTSLLSAWVFYPSCSSENIGDNQVPQQSLQLRSSRTSSQQAFPCLRLDRSR